MRRVRGRARWLRCAWLLCAWPMLVWGGNGQDKPEAQSSQTVTPYGPCLTCEPDDPPPQPARDAQFISQTVPSAMVAGSMQTVSILLKNTGTLAWETAGNYKIGSQNPLSNTTWGNARIELPQTVSPGQTVTITFQIRAPQVAGTYNFQWRMVQDGVTWFGPYTPNVAIKVIAGSIGAGPNPCHMASGSSICTTTVNWNSSSGTSEVWVSDFDGSSPHLFARAQSGSQSAPWIDAYGSRFTLKSDGLTLGSVDVRGIPPPAVFGSSSIDYDELGRAIALRDSAGHIKLSYEYDANGNVTKITDALNHATTMTYDALDRVSTSTDAAGQVTAYQYDVASRLVQVTDARGHATRYLYDGFGQLWQQASPDTGLTGFAYDATGLPLGMTRANGVITTYSYDTLYRRTGTTAGGLTQWATYDNCTNGIGRLCSTGDATGVTSYSYTPEGQVTGRGFSISGTTYALGYSYDSMGRLAAVAYPDGNRATYSYASGRVSGITMAVGTTTFPVASAVTYQPDGAMTSWLSSNGLANTLAYDSDGRLTGISVPGVQNLAFTYDAADRITRITNGMDAAWTQDFGYDALSRLTSVTSAGGNESYQYDATGNRVAQTLNGVSTSSVIDTASNRLLAFGATTYGYDANGNITTVGGTPRYHYDAFNRMDSALGASFYVNPEGQRLRKSGGEMTYFAPDTTGMALADNQAGVWRDYVWLNGRMVAMVMANEVYALHSDQTGRVLAITQPNTALAWKAKGDPFDRNTTSGYSAFFRLGFPGQYWDVEDSLWHNGFRDYDYSTGRYIQSDPIGLAGGINTYVYVEGNPLIYTDPFGLASASGAMADCLAQIFGQSVASVNIRNKMFVRTDFVTTRKNSIRLPPTLSIDEFFADHGLVLHEYYHVLRQWNTGILTRRGYLAEFVRSGSWAEGNRFEDAANEFSGRNVQAFNDCLEHKSENCKK
ncbi:RHS repeat-associated core domain-containing protein [Fulvimonas sp. R45]|uniref:RHS repeat-associated core domain-containing protein n=1 Tax=Fulvimonas sp. R45 TaxID=3045937 RepID=UPI00265FA461|nr:RHS repeat-associated core domain-containing protein [Fulvimonas sp. R45]MDO1527225.1 RHS repeat-associated core domain-containing protein [Fulvimonas sp. R45]